MAALIPSYDGAAAGFPVAPPAASAAVFGLLKVREVVPGFALPTT